MKPSTIILALMSVAVLSACNDKSKSDVKPGTENSQHSNHTPDPCPPCGMG